MAASSVHECVEESTSSRSSTESGSCTRTGVFASGVGVPRTSAMCGAAARLVAVQHRAKRAVRRLHRALGDALDDRFRAAAVVNQVGDRADLDAVLLPRTRSGRAGAPLSPSSLMISQITAAGVQARERGQVAAGFRVARAHQHATRLGLDREHVARLDDVLGARRRGATAAAMVRARSRGGDAGRHALGRLDADRERGAVLRAVAMGHRAAG